MLSRRNTIRRRLTTIRAVQAIYTPSVPALVAAYRQSERQSAPRSTDGSSSVDKFAEDEPLFLPSGLSAEALASCAPGLAVAETRLRDAQLHECLNEVRTLLHLKSGLLIFKKKHVRHQRQNTRARSTIDNNEDRIKMYREKYSAARTAKLALSGPGDWEYTWRELASTDCRTMLADDDPVNAKAAEAGGERVLLSEGRRLTSWIWMGADRDSTDTLGMQDGK